MAVSVRLTTLGMLLCYAVEATAGTRPTTGYTIIPEVKSTPDFDTEPETIDSTTLFEDEYRTSEPGLRDLGGAAAFEANFTDALKDLVDDIIDDYDTAVASGKAMWFCVVHPKSNYAMYLKGRVVKVNFGAASVAEMLGTTIRIYPTQAPFMATKPTDTATMISTYKAEQQGTSGDNVGV